MIFLLLLLPLIALSQDFSEESFTVGGRSSYFTNSSEWDNTFLYYVPEYSSETFGETVGLRRKLKLRVLDYVSSDEKVIIDPLDVSAEFFTNNNSFQVGFLRYRFSETFGVQFLDVANPRDYSEFIINDLAWSKRSVFGVNNTYKWNDLQIQLILTLWPNGDRLPYKDSAFDPTNGQIDYQGGVVERPWLKDLEYGTRFKYLFQNGLDLSFLYYHHFSRPTFLDIKFNNQSLPKAVPTNHLVDSLGSSASYVWENWVLRGDALFTFNDLVQEDLINYKKENHFQALAGIDRNFDNFLFGLQLQGDFATQRHFYGVRSEYTNNTWWKPSVMVFRSFKANDQWLQLKSLFESDDWKFSLVYDNIHGGKDEENLFGLYRTEDRFLVDVSFTY
ncbi:MAG: hypothetical protein NDI69_13445 [Bacteriovoracaceae bacterium]|nr:hypothetical protein [Bacteriovoracaceae bacterium]